MAAYFGRLVAVAIALLVVAVPGMANAQDGGYGLSLSGTLINGTTGAEPPGGVTILLHVFGADPGSVETFDTVTEGDGSFVFDGAPAPPDGGSAILVVDYGGAVYREVLAPTDLAHPLSLTIYDATQDVGVVATTEQSVIIGGVDAATRRVAMVQLLTLENSGDLTLVPDLSAPPVIGQFSFLRFSLPAGASDLDVATDLVGGEIIPVGTGFAITAPVPPGSYQVSFTYTAPYENDSLAWRDNTLQGASRFRLLVPAEFGKIAVDGLPPADPIALSEATYLVWQSENIAPAAGVNLSLTGLPEPSPLTFVGDSLTGSAFWYAAVPAMVATTLVALLVWGVWRRPGVAATGGSAES
jgi:hypothetical protein